MPKGIKGFQKGNNSWKNWKSRPDYSGENNPNYGRKHTEEEKSRMSSLARKGSDHKDWKGDNVGLPALHQYVKKRKPKPKYCERCNKKPPLDLSNDGTYSRDIDTWEWLCRSCHVKKDADLRPRDSVGKFKKYEQN